MMSDQGVVYARFIDDQLEAELARRTSLDERGAKLQQSASVTVGLLATALGLLLGSNQVLSGWPLGLFVISFLVLVAAFLCGVVSTRLVTYEVADSATFEAMLNQRWVDNEVDSRNVTAWVNAKTVEAMRPGNNFKAAWLSYGIWAQGVGVLVGAIAVVVVAAGSVSVYTPPILPTSSAPTPTATPS
jgi:hypothetical protein